MGMLKLARFAPVIILALLTTAPTRASGQGSAAQRAAQTHLQAGDRIWVHFQREPTLSDTAIVNERGEAAFPKLGILPVGALTIAALEDTLRTRYAVYLRNPELQVLVLRRVVVNGEVRVPNVYMMDVSSTVADAIARAGGFTDNANRGRINLVRDGKADRVESWDRGGARALELQSGDEIVVGRRSWWVINALPALSTATIVASLIISVAR